MLIRFTGIFVAAALTAGVANAKDITLRWGHYLGDSPFLQAEKDFATNVTERTEGRVKVEITYAGGLGAGNEVLTLAGRGAIDMASVVPGYYSDQLLYWRLSDSVRLREPPSGDGNLGSRLPGPPLF